MFLFLRQCVKDSHHIGAVAPSSKSLARAVTRSLRQGTGPKRMLEVGPGTGSFTRCMLSALHEGDELHIVEMNPAFQRRLEARLLEPFRRRHPTITVRLHGGPIQTVPLEGHFDYIVCGLPFNNFHPSLVRVIFRRLLGLLAEGGEMTYFEYAGLQPLVAPLLSADRRRQLRQVRHTAAVLRRRHDAQRELVLRNLPPAYAVRLRR